MLNLVEKLQRSEAERQQRKAQERGVDVSVIKEEERITQQALKEQAEERERQREEEDRRRAEEQFRECQKLGHELGIHSAVYIGHILKFGGLTERSSGNGFTKGTVWHVIFEEDYDDGRIHRKPGDLLCRKSTTFGKRTMGLSGFDYWYRERLTGNKPAITCQACLKRLEALRQRSKQ